MQPPEEAMNTTEICLKKINKYSPNAPVIPCNGNQHSFSALYTGSCSWQTSKTMSIQMTNVYNVIVFSHVYSSVCCSSNCTHYISVHMTGVWSFNGCLCSGSNILIPDSSV